MIHRHISSPLSLHPYSSAQLVIPPGSRSEHAGNKNRRQDMAARSIAFFKDIDGMYYIVPISAGINEKDETVYSIGNAQRRRHNTNAGSSSIGGALKNGAVPSRDIPWVNVKCKIADKRKRK